MTRTEFAEGVVAGIRRMRENLRTHALNGEPLNQVPLEVLEQAVEHYDDPATFPLPMDDSDQVTRDLDDIDEILGLATMTPSGDFQRIIRRCASVTLLYYLERLHRECHAAAVAELQDRREHQAK